MLLKEINEAGFQGTFDFIYLPIDPDTKANRGYAFFNFVDPSFSWMFKMYFEGRKIGCFNSSKVLSVTVATLQGFEANYAHYSASRVNCGDLSARPLFSQAAMRKIQLLGRKIADWNTGGTEGKVQVQSAEKSQSLCAGFHSKPEKREGRKNMKVRSALEQVEAKLAIASIGSMGHPHHCGNACKYVRRKGGCRDGRNCQSCHLCYWSRELAKQQAGCNGHLG
jgi:hypothetical protein